ncbi:MAG: MBL fold metallo-hydrolase [Imperialibacter sp.]|uniref:MBL fold metallo-hydrolase n=1 Tax=Imperialibacter sp. TaxID=2038411 RepID=UPI0032EC666F
MSDLENHTASLVSFELKSAGYCTASWHHAQRGAPKKTIRFYATYAVIKHPKHGVILFDTGYAKRFFSSTANYPYKLYRAFTPVFIKPEEEAAARLKADGIQPEDVRYIIVSHFHADHIGGLRDFPSARFICDRAAYDDIKGKSGFGALKKGFLPAQMPENFEARTDFNDIENSAAKDKHLGSLHDLFNDGSILLTRLDGHAKGQLGALLATEKGQIFLISDAAWLKPAYTDLKLPHPIVRLFFDSWADYEASLNRVHNFHKAHPDTLIIPCHCLDTLTALNGSPS